MRRECAGRSGASVWRRGGLPCVMACIVLGGAAAGASAAHGHRPDPTPLWRAYPLEQAAPSANGAHAPRPASPRPVGRPSMPQGAAAAPSFIRLASAATAGALLVLLAVSIRRRRMPAASAIRPDGGNAAIASPTWPASPRPATRRAPADQARRPTRARPRTRRAGSPASGRTAAPRKGPVCQIRWSARSACFYVVTAGLDGHEQRVVRSPQVDWAEPSPPQQTRGAQAAVHELAKELVDRGWWPMRAKGTDFDERQWYARRFRWPSDSNVEDAGANQPGAS